MATITLKGNAIETVGNLPAVASDAASFEFVKIDLSSVTLESLKGKKVVLNIFPSIDTSTCATSVRTFNEKAASLDNTTVLCVAADLPFAFKRFCGAEGIENVESASTFRSSFGKDYGVEITTGPLTGLLSRSVVVIDESGKVVYTEQVGEIADEPNYDAALAALS
ncbi:MAG: thiol peroxidase [Lentisphaeraceae bacterium]|nr:thiol peroxidase [Lentisphaeraceae bacterium]